MNLHFCNYTNIKIPCLIYFGIKHFLGNYFSSHSLKVGEATLETFKGNLCLCNYTNIKISCLIYFKIKHFSIKYLSFVVFGMVEKLGQAKIIFHGPRKNPLQDLLFCKIVLYNVSLTWRCTPQA